MAQQGGGSIAIRLEGSDEVYWAQPRPEDQGRLAELLREGSANASLAEDDLQGHIQSADVTFDVEGHAMTLRLPSAADAAELRRRLAMGAVAVTLVAAGGIAALQGMEGQLGVGTAGPAAAPAPIVQSGFQNPASDVGIMDQAAQGAALQQAATGSQAGFQNPASDVGLMDQAAQGSAQQQAVPQAGDVTAPIAQPGTHRTISDPYNVDLGTSNAAAPAAQSGYQDVASDVGIMDQSATGAAQQAAGGSADDEDSGIPKAGQQPELR